MIPRYYTGVGSRKLPDYAHAAIVIVANELAVLEYRVRSGGADGADTVFANTAKASGGHGEIYRPCHVNRQAMEMAASVHPAWHKMSLWAQKLHARNCFQVLGLDLKSPSDFLVCWTPDGATTESQCSISTGGTATAIRLADRNNVPVFNLANCTPQDVLSHITS